jgi:20S proteasome alpha/beta subunit
MTVIVGILCDNGVAIASDRQSTANAYVPGLYPQAAVQTSTNAVTKISIVGDDILLAVSGLSALGDEYEITIRKHQPNFASRSYELATRKLREEIPNVVRPFLENAELLAKAVGPGPAYGQCTVECLVAANFKDGPKLLQITPLGIFDAAKSESPIKAIGSGQLQADPFLVFLRNTFWPNRLPTVEEGMLAACWAVDYALEVGAPFVGKDINAFSLGRDGRNRFRASQATSDQIRNHRAFIQTARLRLSEMANPRSAAVEDAQQIPTLGK